MEHFKNTTFGGEIKNLAVGRLRLRDPLDISED